MKHVILGAAGQLGRALSARLAGQAIPLTRADVDLTQPQSIREALQRHRPDVVLNCAAYNLVDRAETDADLAMAVNAWGVRSLAEVCRERDCLLVHFSTDYVFGLDVGRSSPYAPEAAPGPVSVYGLSKLAGEYLVRASAARHLIIRTCGLYGPMGLGGKGGNFVETMRRLAAAGQSPRVVADQHCTPSYTVDIAEAVVGLLASERLGIHHLTNAGACSWFEFACAIFALVGAKGKIAAIASNDWKAPARRPGYSVLECQVTLRPWREALAAYLASTPS